MGRHIWFRTPTKDDRQDIFDLYLGKVDHDARPRPPRAPRRARADDQRLLAGDDRAGLLDGADLRALRRARRRSTARDIVEAMTTIESGTAIGVDYVEDETRAVAIHEAGHAVASHVYMQDVLSTRLSIRMRGSSLGHHQAIEKEERFSSWRHEEVGNARLDARRDGRRARLLRRELASASAATSRAPRGRAACMVGVVRHGPRADRPQPGASPTRSASARPSSEIMERFERIGLQIMNRAQAGGTMGRATDRRASSATAPSARPPAQILGQAYVTAVALHAPQPRGGRAGRRRARAARASSTATRSSSCSRRPARGARDRRARRRRSGRRL